MRELTNEELMFVMKEIKENNSLWAQTARDAFISYESALQSFNDTKSYQETHSVGRLLPGISKSQNASRAAELRTAKENLASAEAQFINCAKQVLNRSPEWQNRQSTDSTKTQDSTETHQHRGPRR